MKAKINLFDILKKSLCTFLIFTLTSISFLNESSIAYAMENFDFSERRNLVLILADSSLMNSDDPYIGLADLYSGLNTTNLSMRVKRYAKDVSRKFSNTDVQIVNIPKGKAPLEIATYLKNIYFNNYSEFENYNFSGVVLIGDIAIPKLYNQQEGILSVYPYTDFDDPGFIYNQDLNRFEVDSTKFIYKPEIWHGVINFTESNDSFADIAKFLDKNHLNSIGNSSFVNNSSKILLSDSFNESKLFIEEIKPLYDVFQNANKYLAQNKVTKEVVKSLNAEFQIPEFAQLLENIDDTSDVMMPSLLDSIKVTASDLFRNAVRAQSEKAISTGRYDNGSIYSPLLAIEYLDEYATNYLKRLNDYIQAAYVDAFEEVSVPVNLLKGSTISLKTIDRDGNTQDVGSKNFINHGIDDSNFELIDFGILQDETTVINSHRPQIHGVDYSDINSSRDCRIFRGGGLKDEVYKTMYNNRGALINVDPDDQGPTCYKSPRQTNDYKLARSSYDKDLSSDNCTLFKGSSLQDEFRGSPVELDYESKLDVRSCFAMNSYDEFISKKGIGSILGFPINSGNTTLLNRYENSDDDFMGQSIDGNFNLTRAFSVFADNYDSGDWHNFSSYFLANPVKDTFVKDNPFGENSPIASLQMDIRKFPTNKFISSLTIHADPDGGVVEKALISGNLNIPVDHRNYVTYYDSFGEFQKDILPDAFYANSSEEYLDQINQSLSKVRSLNLPLDKQQTLEQMMSMGFADSLNDPVSLDNVSFVSVPKLQFLIDYLKLDLNSKYRLVLKNLLDGDFPLEINGFSESFDFVEINSFSDQNQILFDLSSPGFSDNQISMNLEAPVEVIEESFDVDSSGESIFTYFTQYLPEWFEEQSQRVSSVFDSDSYGFEIEDDYESDFKYSSAKPVSLEVQGLPRFIDVNSDSIEFDVVSLTANSDISKDYEELLTIFDSSKFQILNEDLDDQSDGTQIKFEDGVARVKMAPLETGEVNLKLETYFYYVPLFEEKFELLVGQPKTKNTINYEFSTKFVDGLKISADDFFAFQQVSADEVAPLNFSFKILDAENQIVDFSNPTIKASKSVKVQNLENSNGVYNYKISLPPKAGDYEFDIAFNGVLPKKHIIKVLPGETKNLKLSTPNKLFSGLNSNDFTVNVNTYDSFNNKTRVNQDLELEFDDSKVVLNTNITPRLSNGQSTIKFKTLPLKNGYFDINVKVGDLQEKLSFHLALGLTNQDLQGINSNSLTYLLNTNKSELFNKKSENLLISGITQAIITNSNNQVNKQSLLNIHPDKSLEVFSDSMLKTNIEFESESFVLDFYYDNQKFLKIPFNQSDLNRVSTNPSQFTKDNLFVFEPLLTSDQITYDSKSISFIDDEIISTDQGLQLSDQISFSDPSYTIVNQDNIITFKIIYDSNYIANLHLNTSKATFLESPIYYEHPLIYKKSENSHKTFNYLNSINFYKNIETTSSFINSNSSKLSKGLDNPSRFANSDDKSHLLQDKLWAQV